MSPAVLLSYYTNSLPPLLLPTVVSETAAGGQVLMCTTTFKAIKDLTRELGCVTKDGMQADRMDKPSWMWWR